MKNITISLLALSLALAQPALAQTPSKASASGIVAVVNDQAITSYDLTARIKFILATTQISSAPESLARIRPQIIRALIDERLQWQEAQREGIEVGEKEITQAIAAIETQRGMKAGDISRMLAHNNIPPETFTNQLRSQIAWGKLVGKKLRTRVSVSDEEVEQMAEKMGRPQIKQEMEIALLQLPVDKPAREAEVRAAAEKLVLDVRGGANFEEVSRQFAGASARGDGKLASFWVRPEQLDPAIAAAIKGAQAGFISNPLRNAGGYALIKVYNTREIEGGKAKGTEITFREITLRLRSSASEKEAEALKENAEAIAKNPGKCSDKIIPEFKNSDLFAAEVTTTQTMLAELPAALRVIAEGMKEGDISSPLASDEGIKLYMLCGKREGVDAPVDRERARSVVYQQRMELEAQKYMRNLRRDGFIEIRG